MIIIIIYFIIIYFIFTFFFITFFITSLRYSQRKEDLIKEYYKSKQKFIVPFV